ncbi:hypothetical protein BAUCODRAFT_144301 [Baudoinia panamericana UAMH 10762]|uniref:Calcineurin-like phosphoesterase domain-containing protein n=1 Tax=Baudoinia panamericana (strain UAMH 10762) TaxID=717646 RepID=M2NMB9_BAUPA|nr:uncharacterized protein BAUCODRAFT_144301 [Baudoinia panamericana UAMH 10762]EMD00660.1 hypothetical protein BAUCODRAFT_144301 [Baudoinia panamericana UAMH 10762]
MATRKIRIVCMSDTHNHAPGEGYTVPQGDLFIHAGDLTNQGSHAELRKAAHWLGQPTFTAKVVTAGNHDLSLDEQYSTQSAEGWAVQSEKVTECQELFEHHESFTYLQHSSTTVRLEDKNVSLRVFGSPFSPDRGTQNWAFQYPPDESEALWQAIPEDTDVLITHTPPAGYCDTSAHWVEGGCASLLRRLCQVRPLLHVCGHCHEGRGVQIIRWSDSAGEVESVRTWRDPGRSNKKMSLLDLTGDRDGLPLEVGKETAVVNASIMAKSFGRGSKAFNKPIVVDISVPASDHTLSDREGRG